MKKYAENHEYADVQGNIATMGISLDAADELGDIAEVFFPEIGAAVKQGEEFMKLESIKAVQELYAPMSGKIVALNTELTENPELINDDPEGKGWIVKIEITDASELDNLADEDPF